MTQHDDFLEGFHDALGSHLSPEELERHYHAWVFQSEMNIPELIDFESTGYQTGLEAGTYFKQTHSL